MSRTSFTVQLFVIGTMVLGASLAAGQEYPSKPVRIVTSGGGQELISRLISQGLSGPLGQTVVVDPRGSGLIPGDVVAKSPPDGYTLLTQGATFWIASLVQKTPYDPVKDFSPISLMARVPNILVINPALPVKSIKELIALAKAKPGQLNYSSGETGSSSHLAGALFNSMAGVNMVRIPYKSGAQEIGDLVTGQVQVHIDTPASLMEQVKAGKLRMLAVTTLEPSALFPGLPTVATTVPGYDWTQVSCLFAPAKTPAAIIDRINQEIVRFLKTADAKEKLLNLGYEAIGSSPEQLASAMKVDMTRLSKVIKDADIH